MAEMAAAAAAPEAPAAGGGKKLGLIAGLTAGGALLGGLVAAFVVAPRFISRSPAGVHAASPASTVPDSAGAGRSAGKGGEAAEKKMVQLSNIIVNPAGSQGTRFLMTSVAIAVANDEVQKTLTEREVELRDHITTILEAETMAQLTAPGARDTLKAKIATVVSSMTGPGVPFRIFVPQFVIQ